jgi:predicted lipoprotein with Yx(FWY)xxD motif
MMPGLHRIKLGAAVLGALVAGVIFAGCGSSDSSRSETTTATEASRPPSTVSTTRAKGVSVGTAMGPHGTYLVGPSGRALYLWAADSNGWSNCVGRCAELWQPLLTAGSPVASGSAVAADLGTITRSDAAQQVTYKGHPLYYFLTDHVPGSTNGQGSDGFGAKWWLLTPAGSAMTPSAPPGSSGISASGEG